MCRRRPRGTVGGASVAGDGRGCGRSVGQWGSRSGTEGLVVGTSPFARSPWAYLLTSQSGLPTPRFCPLKPGAGPPPRRSQRSTLPQLSQVPSC